jgi:uncharacterized protein (TIGR02270 family)
VAISLIERHLDEASFAWTQRELCASLPNHDLASLGELDAVLEAHLDALRVAGDPAWAQSRARAVDGGDAGVAFAATELALSRRDLAGFAALVQAASAEGAIAEGVRGALAWAALDSARPALERMLAPDLPPSVRRIAIAACADRRLDPKDALDQALRADDPAMRAVALHAAGVLGDDRRAVAVRGDLAHPDRKCRAAAVVAGALLRDEAAMVLLPEMAFAPGAADDACELLALLEEKAPLRDLSALPPRRALRYAGASGDERQAAWLLSKLAELPTARGAGDAFTMITGADFSRPPLRGEAPAGFEGGPNDDPNDPAVALDPDQGLPWPAVDQAARWWAARPRHEARVLLGGERSDAWLERVLQSGRQRQRSVAALALKLRRPGRPLFNVRAPAFRQIRALG